MIHDHLGSHPLIIFRRNHCSCKLKYYIIANLGTNDCSDNIISCTCCHYNSIPESREYRYSLLKTETLLTIANISLAPLQNSICKAMTISSRAHHAMLALLLLTIISTSSAYSSPATQLALGRRLYNLNPLPASLIRAPESELLVKSKRSKVAVVLASDDSISTFRTKPFNAAVTWNDVMVQVAEKMRWEAINSPELDNNGKNALEDLSLDVFTLQQLIEFQQNKGIGDSLSADVVLLVGLPDLNDAQLLLSRKALDEFCTTSKAIVPLDCAESTYFSEVEKYGDFNPLNSLEPVLSVWDGIIKGERFRNRALQSIVRDLWLRKSSGDILFMALVLADSFCDICIKSVKSVTNTDTTSFEQLSCMVSNCRAEIFDCLSDPECKAALDCLNSCKGNDQVCSYRCITSHETAKFEKFALCILQKNNCMGNTATAPVYPDPQPMTMFRGEPLTHEAAEGIFVGHLEPREGELNQLLQPNAAMEPWSWKVS